MEGKPLSAETVARRFSRARTNKVRPILETLVAVGQAQVTAEDLFFVSGGSAGGPA